MFSFRFCAVHPKDVRDSQLRQLFEVPYSQKQAILIVEDDDLVRALAVEIVEEAGYVALQAANADEAVIILESRSDIAVLFSDINMPGSMDGLKLAHAVRDRWPPIKIVIVSGKNQLAPTEIPSGSRFFSKPYLASTMVFELRALVGPSEIEFKRALS